MDDKLCLTKSLEKNINVINSIFSNDSTLKLRRLENTTPSLLKACLFYIDGMVNNRFVSENIVAPFLRGHFNLTNFSNDLFEILKTQVIFSNDLEECTDLNSIISAILYGNTVLILDGYAKVLIISSKGWMEREIKEPTSDKILRGPKEGFNEHLLTNLSLIRRKIKQPNLKFHFRDIGKYTNTKICVCYIQGVAEENILKDLFKRLDNISLNSLLESEYIQEILDDAPLSPFETIYSTEKPDIVAGKLLEGRIAIIVDGTPFVLTLPFLFMEYFQNGEDYYTNYFFASINRLLRILGFLLSTSIPAIYIALVTYNQELIPTPLLMSISAARQSIPLPTIAETLIMLIVFEMLREAGTRIPSNMGQAISIVGALVLGQAAVEAKIISAPIVIIVGLTGIVGLINIKIKAASITLRFIYVFLASFLGLHGYYIGFIGTLLYLMSLNSFGVPYMLNAGSIEAEHLKDSFIRTSWWYLHLEHFIISSKNKVKRK